MLMLRPLSTVEELHAALKHEQLLRGDLVRAEVLKMPRQALKALLQSQYGHVLGLLYCIFIE